MSLGDAADDLRHLLREAGEQGEAHPAYVAGAHRQADGRDGAPQTARRVVPLAWPTQNSTHNAASLQHPARMRMGGRRRTGL